MLHETAQEPIRRYIPAPTGRGPRRGAAALQRRLRPCRHHQLAGRRVRLGRRHSGVSAGGETRTAEAAHQHDDPREPAAAHRRARRQARLWHHRLRVGPIKMFIDGSLIGRTAAVTQPVRGRPAPGQPGTDDDAEGAVRGLRHAGAHRRLPDRRARDRRSRHRLGAGRLREGADRQPRADHRHRIEHCGICRPDILDRIQRLGVIPVSQPVFIIEYGDGFIRHLGL